MTLLVFALLVVIICALATWAISLLPITQPIKGVLMAVAVLFGIIAVANRAGLF